MFKTRLAILLLALSSPVSAQVPNERPLVATQQEGGSKQVPPPKSSTAATTAQARPQDVRNPAPVGTPVNPNLQAHSVTSSPNFPESCQVARKDALAILKELDSNIPSAAQAQAEQVVAKHNRTTTLARAWDDFAAVANLHGKSAYASWAGLKAVQLDWQPTYVTNAGIFFFSFGRNKEALELLSCAYDMGNRSPYLLEALAAVHRRTGDTAKAKQEIQQAQDMAPDDRIINLEVSLLNTGHPPSERQPTEALDRCVASVEKRARSAVSSMKGMTDKLDRLSSDLPASRFMAIDASLFQKEIEILRQQVQAVRTFSKGAGPASPAQARLMLQNRYNNVLLTCIGVYVLTTDTLLNFPSMISVDGMGVLFWADVLQMDPKSFADEQHADSEVSYRPGDLMSPKLAIAAQRRYGNDLRSADIEETRQLHACKSNACQIRAEAAFCATWRQLYNQWQTESLARFDRGAHNYDHVSARTLGAAATEILDARNFAAHTFNDMRFEKSSVPSSGHSAGAVNPAEQTLRALNMQYHTFLNRQFSKSSPMGTAKFLSDEGENFVKERTYVEGELAREAVKLEEKCQPIEKRMLELLAQEEYQEALKMLADKMAGDIDAKWDPKVNCEFSVGPFSVTIDDTSEKGLQGKYAWKEKTFWEGPNGEAKGSLAGTGNASFDKNGQFVGASGNVTAGVEGNTGPFVGKAEISLVGGYKEKNDSSSGGIEAGVDLKASLGLGVKRGPLAAACYPGEADVHLDARALVDDAAAYYRALSNGPSGKQ
jgi:tetratricopeptide (TPR) repeat protein